MGSIPAHGGKWGLVRRAGSQDTWVTSEPWVLVRCCRYKDLSTPEVLTPQSTSETVASNPKLLPWCHSHPMNPTAAWP